jgi:CHAT domain-containing protein
LRMGKPPEGAELLKSLRILPRAYCLIFFPSAACTYLWRVEPDGKVAAWRKLPPSRRHLRTLAGDLLTAIEAEKPLPQSLNEFASLLRPELAEIPEGETVCFVPGGPLLQFPFAVLPYESRYLIERNPVATLPSLSVLTHWQRRTMSKSSIAALVLGDSLDDLPEARREAVQVAKFFGVEARLGREVVRLNFSGVMHACRVLHVACHARYVAGEPLLSGFRLADGSIFSARDLRELRLTARLAVLSACESGRLEVRAGDESIGLSASILYAGVPAVMASLWRVDDEQTGRLMSVFYSEVLKNRTDLVRALQAAQCKVLSRRETSARHPYYWAAFQLSGDWHNDL